MSTKQERSKFMEENDRHIRQLVNNDLAKYRRVFIQDYLEVPKASN